MRAHGTVPRSQEVSVFRELYKVNMLAKNVFHLQEIHWYSINVEILITKKLTFKLRLFCVAEKRREGG